MFVAFEYSTAVGASMFFKLVVAVDFITSR